MPITEQMITQAWSDLKAICGGVKNDYFGLLYLERNLSVPREKAQNQVSFGGNDYGIDGFHFEPNTRNLYLFQFKNSPSYTQFKGSLQRLIDAGMERIFSTPNADDSKNQILLQLRACMLENRKIIDQVSIRFIFTGDPADAERSQVLDKLREDLEDKKHLVEKFFLGRTVPLLVEFRSSSGKVGVVKDHSQTSSYNLELAETISRLGPDGERMHIGFARLVDLAAMYRDLEKRFFERNIRYGLGGTEFVNRSISRSLKAIIVDSTQSASAFAFNHNGITIFAEKLEYSPGQYTITSPRLLNGAQTVTTFAEFLEKNKDNPKLQANQAAVVDIRVLCKVITDAKQDFVVNVTINNNRQNPVDSWSLHANDLIQLELHDLFRDELKVYYERQKNAFSSLTQPDMDREGIVEGRPIQLLKLAHTFLVSDGNIAALSHVSRVFEDEGTYNQVFNASRLKADPRHIVLCYKIQYKLGRLIGDVEQKGKNKYWFLSRGRSLFWALLCQAVLNDVDLERIAEEFGCDMVMKVAFIDYLSKLASTRCRPMLSSLIEDPAYSDKVAEQNLSFLRTNAAFKRCMETAWKSWKWVEKRL